MNRTSEPPTPTTAPAPCTAPPRLLDQVRVTAQAAGHPEQTIAAFVAWNCRYILFHGKQHPRELAFLQQQAQRVLDAVERGIHGPPVAFLWASSSQIELAG